MNKHSIILHKDFYTLTELPNILEKYFGERLNLLEIFDKEQRVIPKIELDKRLLTFISGQGINEEYHNSYKNGELKNISGDEFFKKLHTTKNYLKLYTEEELGELLIENFIVNFSQQNIEKLRIKPIDFKEVTGLNITEDDFKESTTIEIELEKIATGGLSSRVDINISSVIMKIVYGEYSTNLFLETGMVPTYMPSPSPKYMSIFPSNLLIVSKENLKIYLENKLYTNEEDHYMQKEPSNLKNHPELYIAMQCFEEFYGLNFKQKAHKKATLEEWLIENKLKFENQLKNVDFILTKDAIKRIAMVVNPEKKAGAKKMVNDSSKTNKNSK